MSLYKKKNKTPLIFEVLDAEYNWANYIKESYFFYPLPEEEYVLARKWCMQHNVEMKLSHQDKRTDFIYYKFYW